MSPAPTTPVSGRVGRFAPRTLDLGNRGGAGNLAFVSGAGMAVVELLPALQLLITPHLAVRAQLYMYGVPLWNKGGQVVFIAMDCFVNWPVSSKESRKHALNMKQGVGTDGSMIPFQLEAAGGHRRLQIGSALVMKGTRCASVGLIAHSRVCIFGAKQ